MKPRSFCTLLALRPTSTAAPVRSIDIRSRQRRSTATAMAISTHQPTTRRCFHFASRTRHQSHTNADHAATQNHDSESKQGPAEELGLPTTHTKHCWSCSRPIPSTNLTCRPDCAVVQPLSPQINYFQLFSLEETFNVDVKDIRNKYLKYQQSVHPDNFSTKSETERIVSEASSTVVNKAYQTLRNPLRRALYMLRLHNASLSETESLTDPELLMNVLEMRERLEECLSETELAEIKEENDAKIQETLNDLAAAFENKDHDLAKQLTVQLKYWEKINKEIAEWSPKAAVLEQAEGSGINAGEDLLPTATQSEGETAQGVIEELADKIHIEQETRETVEQDSSQLGEESKK